VTEPHLKEGGGLFHRNAAMCLTACREMSGQPAVTRRTRRAVGSARAPIWA
jgi:hypothetical protein